MTEPGHNEGIHISGGTLNAGALAVGRYASAVSTVGSASEVLAGRGERDVAERMKALLEQLRLHSGELANADELVGATESVATELARDVPNKLTVLGVLGGIAASVASVAGVTEAVDALIEAVKSLG